MDREEHLRTSESSREGNGKGGEFPQRTDFADIHPAEVLEDKLDRNAGKLRHVPLVLQITKIRNVSQPRVNEHRVSDKENRLLRISLTDGKHSINALEVGIINALGMSTPPGIKVQLFGSVPIEKGLLLVDNDNCRLIGGRVDDLIDKWKIDKEINSKQRHLNQHRTSGSAGPPPWVPFGKKLQTTNVSRNFKSMEAATATTSADAPTADNVEFEQQRKAEVAKLQRIDNRASVNKFSATQSAAEQAKAVAHSAPITDHKRASTERDSAALTGEKSEKPVKLTEAKMEKLEKKKFERLANYLDADDRREEQKISSGPATLFDFLGDQLKTSKGSNKLPQQQSQHDDDYYDDRRDRYQESEPPSNYDRRGGRGGRGRGGGGRGGGGRYNNDREDDRVVDRFDRMSLNNNRNNNNNNNNNYNNNNNNRDDDRYSDRRGGGRGGRGGRGLSNKKLMRNPIKGFLEV